MALISLTLYNDGPKGLMVVKLARYSSSRQVSELSNMEPLFDALRCVQYVNSHVPAEDMIVYYGVKHKFIFLVRSIMPQSSVCGVRVQIIIPILTYLYVLDIDTSI